MPAINFMKQFAEKIKSGKKKQTIRPLRKDCRNPRPGQSLYLYTGLRTKGCRKIGEVICKNVEQFTIEENYEIFIGVRCLELEEKYNLAKADGFDSFRDFVDFFIKRYGLPFYGLIIKW